MAAEVVAAVRKGKKPNISEIARRHGYSKSSVRAMKVQKTKAFQAVVQPVLEQLEQARLRALARMPKAEKKAKYRDLVDGVDKMTKNIQLLSGGATANVAIGIRKLSDEELQEIADGKKTE